MEPMFYDFTADLMWYLEQSWEKKGFKKGAE